MLLTYIKKASSFLDKNNIRIDLERIRRSTIVLGAFKVLVRENT